MRHEEPKTYAEIAAIMGVSRQRVEQIAESGLRKLRQAYGSTFRGRHKVYECEGIADPGTLRFTSKRRHPKHGARP